MYIYINIFIPGVSKRSKQFEKLLYIKKYEVFDQHSFQLDKLTSFLPQVAKSLVCDT